MSSERGNRRPLLARVVVRGVRTLRTAPARARRTALVERDLRAFRRRWAPILGARAAPAGGPHVLIASLTEFPYQLKLEGMLTKALELEGCTVTVLAPTGAAQAREYHRVFGLDRFVELRDYMTEELEAEAAAEAARILAEPLDAAALKELEFRGAAVGRYVLSTISRNLHASTVDLDDPEARTALGWLLPAAVRSALAADALLDDLRPDIVLFNERNYSDQGPLSDAALRRRLNVVQFVSALQDEGLVFKRFTPESRGLHPRSLSDSTWEVVRGLPWGAEQEGELDEELGRRYDGSQQLSQRLQEWTRPYAPDEILRSLGLDPGKRTAVVFSHVLWDANMFYGADLFADQGEWFVETVRAACANDRVNWIVKLHPANVWKLRRDQSGAELDETHLLRERVGELPPHVAVLRPESDVSARSVFDVADWGVTIRGSVGFELPCLGVPVLTAGTGFYSGRGFTVDSGSAEEYLGRLDRIEETPALTPEALTLARRHAHALFRLRPTRFTSFRTILRPLDEIGHVFDHDLVPTVGSHAELTQARDLRRFAHWVVRTTDPDYLDLD
jgi:hypothetical protein